MAVAWQFDNAKAKAWQVTCFSLSPKSNPKPVYYLLHSVAGSSSSSSSPNFPNCSSPRKPASVFADYLRSHFSASQPKALRSRATGYLSELRQAMCPEEPYLSFCSPFSPAEFFAVATNLFSISATGTDKVAYPVLKHLPRSGMNFLLHIFYFPGLYIPFLPPGRHIPLFPSIKWESLSAFLLPFGLSLSPPASQSFLNALFYHIYSSFWSLIPFSLPARPVSALDGLLQIKFCSFLSPFQMGLTNPDRALEQFSL